MYLIINETPSEEQISRYRMLISENDAYLNYRIDLTGLLDDEKMALCETYAFHADKLKKETSLILAIPTDV